MNSKEFRNIALALIGLALVVRILGNTNDCPVESSLISIALLALSWIMLVKRDSKRTERRLYKGSL